MSWEVIDLDCEKKCFFCGKKAEVLFYYRRFFYSGMRECCRNCFAKNIMWKLKPHFYKQPKSITIFKGKIEEKNKE